jgi:hypothetical protein
MAARPVASSASNIPIPDPSLLTSEQIVRAKEELRTEFGHQIEALRALIGARLDAMDRAADLLAENVNRYPTLLDREIGKVRELFEEKFGSIATQFRERDIRTDQDKIAASTAVNAALQAQKEAAGAQNESNAAAITKSENSFTKEIDGLKSLITTTKDAINSQIANLTGRLDRGEGNDIGSRQHGMNARANIGTVVGVVGGIVGILALLASLTFGVLNQRNTSSQPTVVSPAVVPVQPR